MEGKEGGREGKKGSEKMRCRECRRKEGDCGGERERERRKEGE